jgi:tetratricopeptide (TPR) repeat protein
MARLAGLRISPALCLISILCISCPFFRAAAQESLGNIVGRVRVIRGDTPPQRILVFLDLNRSPMDSTYTDSQGQFGFHNLQPNTYEVRIDDEQYQPVRVTADIHPISLSPTVMLDIQLTPKNSPNSSAPASRQQGSNPNIMDIREYSKDFPKKTVKEFEKGIEADRDNKKDDAIAHYRKAIEISPDFYPAHNNLGSDELSQSHLDAAKIEFATVVKLNQSDASAYFNLANVAMLQGQLSEANNFLDEGFRRQPDSALGKFLLGTVDLRAGKLSDAELALRQSIQLDPSMAQPRLQLVNLYLKQGRKPDAIDQLHSFLTTMPLSPFSPRAKQILQRLETDTSQSGTNLKPVPHN